MSKKRIHYSCEDWIEKSVPHDLTPIVITRQAPRCQLVILRWIFLSHTHTHDRFINTHHGLIVWYKDMTAVFIFIWYISKYYCFACSFVKLLLCIGLKSLSTIFQSYYDIPCHISLFLGRLCFSCLCKHTVSTFLTTAQLESVIGREKHGVCLD